MPLALTAFDAQHFLQSDDVGLRLAQHGGAVAERFVVQLESALEREQHIAAAGMHDPGGDVAAVQVRALEHGREDALRVVGGERRLIGTVTDGDVRRAILYGVALDATVGAAPVPSTVPAMSRTVTVAFAPGTVVT